MNRKVFDKLHEELSLSQDRLYPRYDLWVSVREYGYDADNLQPSEASNWCRDNGHLLVASKMAKYKPDVQTPEEIMGRICGED
jgi:hypothetical protein